MRKLLCLVFVFTYVNVSAQKNEFANQNFYDVFNKIHKDGKNGFPLYKKGQIKTEFDGAIDKFKIGVLLPGSDSGFIYKNIFQNISAIYYFKPKKTEAEAGQQVAWLKEAIQNATGKTVYEEKELSEDENVKGYITGFFLKSNHSISVDEADIVATVYEANGKFNLALRIRGVIPGKSSITPEPNLDKWILAVFNDMLSCFSASKGKLSTGPNKYTTYYDTRQTLFGITGTVEENSNGCTMQYEINGTKFSGLEEATKIYEQMKKALTGQLSNWITFKPEIEGGNEETSFVGREPGSNSKKLINLTITSNEAYPIIHLYIFFNKK
jgi:hypothetical protein